MLIKESRMLKDHEVRALRDHLKWHQESISMTAKNTGLSRATVRKYRHGKLPSNIKTQRKPRQGEPTRPSPFAPEHSNSNRGQAPIRKDGMICLLNFRAENPCTFHVQ